MSAGERKSWFGLVREVWGRRRWLAILVFAGASVAGVSLTLSLPTLYRSTATVLVERQQMPDTLVKSSVTSEFETRMQTVSEQILSRERLKELITRFDLYPDMRQRESMETVVEQMRRDIK